MKQIGILSAFVVAFSIAALSFANSPQKEAEQERDPGNVFAGKAIIITPTVGVAGTPREGIRIELLADRKFLVYSVNDDDTAYDYWMAADQISRLRVFPDMKEATAFYDRNREKGVFH